MKKVRKDKYDLNNAEIKLLNSIDFMDVFSTTNHIDSIKNIIALMFNNLPSWLGFLLSLRNFMVSFFGLKTELNRKLNDVNLGFFEIYETSKTKMVLGVDDRHLNFRVIVCNTNEQFYNVKIVTLVHYNNYGGRIYMNMIKPFHVMVLNAIVKRVYKPL